MGALYNNDRTKYYHSEPGKVHQFYIRRGFESYSSMVPNICYLQRMADLIPPVQCGTNIF